SLYTAHCNAVCPLFLIMFFILQIFDKLPEEHEFIKLLTLPLVVFAFSTEKTSTIFYFESSFI
ncbi:hypothetical protein VBK23_05930, partial [Enterobacter hormaechei]|nr:hypothetical protein [Enterobacter hormaechei]